MATRPPWADLTLSADDEAALGLRWTASGVRVSLREQVPGSAWAVLVVAGVVLPGLVALGSTTGSTIPYLAASAALVALVVQVVITPPIYWQNVYEGRRWTVVAEPHTLRLVHGGHRFALPTSRCTIRAEGRVLWIETDDARHAIATRLQASQVRALAALLSSLGPRARAPEPPDDLRALLAREVPAWAITPAGPP